MIYSTAVDTKLLAELTKLTGLRRGYRIGSDHWYYFTKINHSHPTLSGFPARILAAKVSKISAKKFKPVPADHGWHRDDDLPPESARLLIPLSKWGNFQIQVENKLPVDIKYGYAYAFNAKDLHRLCISRMGKRDFYMLVLDCAN
jgi:hypothetical protein